MIEPSGNDPRRAGTIWVLNLDEPVPIVEPSVPVTFRQLTSDVLPDLATSILGNVTAETLGRLNAGKHCYTAWFEDRLAAYGWVSFVEEHIGELNLRVHLLPGEVYIWDCATASEDRGKHIYSALLSHMIQELWAQGFCRAWIGADRANVISQKGMARAGFHHVADLVVERVLAVPQVWVYGLSGVPDHIVSEARRAFLNDRSRIWRNAASSLQQG